VCQSQGCCCFCGCKELHVREGRGELGELEACEQCPLAALGEVKAMSGSGQGAFLCHPAHRNCRPKREEGKRGKGGKSDGKKRLKWEGKEVESRTKAEGETYTPCLRRILRMSPTALEKCEEGSSEGRAQWRKSTVSHTHLSPKPGVHQLL